MKYKTYKAKYELCQICNERQGILMPLCRDGEKTFFFLTCHECRDEVPYEVIPIKTKIDTGFFFCPHVPDESIIKKISEGE